MTFLKYHLLCFLRHGCSLALSSASKLSGWSTRDAGIYLPLSPSTEIAKACHQLASGLELRSLYLHGMHFTDCIVCSAFPEQETLNKRGEIKFISYQRTIINDKTSSKLVPSGRKHNVMQSLSFAILQLKLHCLNPTFKETPDKFRLTGHSTSGL